MKRSLLVFGCLAIFCLFALVISQAKNQTKKKTDLPVAGRPIAIAQQPIGTVSIGAYAAAGLPVALNAGLVNSDKGFAELPCRLGLTGSSEVESINLALFQLEPTGKLRGIQGWTQFFHNQTPKTDDKTGGRFFDFPLRLQGHLNAPGALLLALESVSGPAGTWELDSTELLQTVVARAGGRPDAQATVRQQTDRQRGDYGSNYCARAFALTFYLSKFSEGGSPPAFTCDQQERAFVATYPVVKAAASTQ